VARFTEIPELPVENELAMGAYLLWANILSTSEKPIAHRSSQPALKNGVRIKLLEQPLRVLLSFALNAQFIRTLDAQPATRFPPSEPPFLWL
jgi:hypothetical protein